MIAARELIRLKLGRDYTPEAGEIYSLKYSDKDLKRNPVIKENEIMADECIEVIENYVDAISKGKFHLSQLEERENKVCRFCTYRTVCRIDELK